MKPQQEVEVSITVTAPKRPGQYRLEFDVVQESVLWFQSMGSATIQIPCQIQASGRVLRAVGRRLRERVRAVRGFGAGVRLGRRLLRGLRTVAAGQAYANPPVAPTAGFEPIMETYGIPKDVLVKWIENHGGRVIEIQNDLSVGKDWESFRYYITKP
jgi:hypothetical protein